MSKKIVNYSLAVLCVLVACHVAKKVPESKKSSELFDTQGHRGSRGLMPENTFPAMKTALGLQKRFMMVRIAHDMPGQEKLAIAFINEYRYLCSYRLVVGRATRYKSKRVLTNKI